MVDKMKYYIYVSDTKVEMLYSQIPRHLRETVATELKIDLKFLSTTFSEDPTQETRYSKLEIVTKNIERSSVIGTVDKPGTYFQGTMRLRWGPFEPFNEMIYFGGRTAHTILGLAGSTQHLISRIGSSEFSMGISEAPNILRVLLTLDNPEKDASETSIDDDELGLVAKATGLMKGPEQRLEFLAKRLIEGYARKENARIVLGSPIYVALAE